MVCERVIPERFSQRVECASWSQALALTSSQALVCVCLLCCDIATLSSPSLLRSAVRPCTHSHHLLSLLLSHSNSQCEMHRERGQGPGEGGGEGGGEGVRDKAEYEGEGGGIDK
eukprot:106687-Rhodomonas_salina.1